MRISVVRSGGFAGLSEEVASVDTERLAPAAARAIEGLVREIGFFELPASPAAGAVGADLYRYQITVVQGERSKTVTCTEDDTPQAEPLRRLLRLLSP